MMHAIKENQEVGQRIKRVNPEFLSNLTHEFLTPLSIISLNIQIIEKLEARSGDTKGGKYLSTIKHQVERLNEVVHDSIELLKLDTLNEEVEPKETDLVEMLEAIKNSIDLCEQQLLFRSLVKTEHLILKTDNRLLRTSVFRLVNHACATYRTQVPELVLRDCPEYVIIEIFNHDVHLDAEDFNHIFNPFNRTTELEKIEGMSLALTIIKDRLRLVGAQFQVESLPDQGIKYSIRLPKS